MSAHGLMASASNNIGAVSETTTNAKQPYVHHFRITKKKTNLEFKMVDASDIRKNMYGANNKINDPQQQLPIVPTSYETPSTITTSTMMASSNPGIPSPVSENNPKLKPSKHKSAKISKKQTGNRRNSTFTLSDPSSLVLNASNQQDQIGLSPNANVSINRKGITSNRRKSTAGIQDLAPIHSQGFNTYQQGNHQHQQPYIHTPSPHQQFKQPSPTANPSYFNSGFSFGSQQQQHAYDNNSDDHSPSLSMNNSGTGSPFKIQSPPDPAAYQNDLYGEDYFNTLTAEQRRYLNHGGRRTFATLPSIDEITRHPIRKNSIEELTQDFSQVSTTDSDQQNVDRNILDPLSDKYRNDNRFRRRPSHIVHTDMNPQHHEGYNTQYDSNCLQTLTSFHFPPLFNSNSNQSSPLKPIHQPHHHQHQTTPFPHRQQQQYSSSQNNNSNLLPPISHFMHEN